MTCNTCGGRGYIVVAGNGPSDEQEPCPECNYPQPADPAATAQVLIAAWAAANGQQCPWRTAVKITAVVCNLDVATVEGLLKL